MIWPALQCREVGNWRAMLRVPDGVLSETGDLNQRSDADFIALQRPKSFPNSSNLGIPRRRPQNVNKRRERRPCSSQITTNLPPTAFRISIRLPFQPITLQLTFNVTNRHTTRATRGLRKAHHHPSAQVSLLSGGSENENAKVAGMPPLRKRQRGL